MKKILNISINISGSVFKCGSFKENSDEVLCIYKGEITSYPNQEVIVRIHSGCITSEVFGMNNCDCKWQLDKSIELIKNTEYGLIIYIPGHEGKGNGLFNKIRSFEMKNAGISSNDAYELIGLPADKRSFDFAIKVLKELGIKRIKLITNSPAKVMACIDGGITVTERIPIIIDNPNPIVKRLLENKKNHFNHLIN
jgi:GTP cyclohydrolase II